MPTYTYECPRCEYQQTEILTLAEHDTFKLRHCHRQMFQVMFAPQITTDIQPYRSMVTGERIAGRSQHREHLKQHGCVEVGNEAPPKARTKSVITRSQRREVLNKQLGDMSDKQANKLLKQIKKDLHV